MKKSYLVRTAILAGGLLLQLGALCLRSHGAAGDVDLFFDLGSGVNGTVNAVAVQPDGKVLIGGAFTTVKGLARPGIARLNADGSGDPTFNPGTNAVGAFALQPDGKVIVCRQSTNGNQYAARLNGNGTLDGSFVAAPGSYPYGSRFGRVVVQPDGKVLLGGEFTDVYIDFDGNWWYFSCYLVVRLNPNGSSDPSFPDVTGGDFYTYNDTYLTAVALQSDGKVLIGTTYWTSRIVRLNANGSPDSTFNPGTGPNSYLRSIVVHPDGKVLIGGYFTAVNGTNRNGLARLNANGTLDSSFLPGVGGAYPIISSIGLQPDGKVLISGYFTEVNGTNRRGIARLNANGSLDSSFDPGTGMAYGFVADSLVVQTDGKVLIGGAFDTVNDANRNNIARLNSNGSLDSSFNPGTDTGISGSIATMVVQPDGKVLVGGAFTTVNGLLRTNLARFNPDGSGDPAFNPAIDYVPYSRVSSLALQSDGRLLVGNEVPVDICDEFGCTSFVELRLSRLNTNGSPDPGFNPAAGFGPYPAYGSALTVQSDGKVLVGGDFWSMNDDANRTGMARLNANGTLDGSFNPVVGGYYPGVHSIAVQTDGKVLVGGSFTTIDATNRNYIARLKADGSLDGSFNPGAGANGWVSSLALQPDGKVLIGGYFTALNGTNRNGIARFNASGSLDSSFNAGAGTNSYVWTLAAQPDGEVLIGGDFSTLNGTNRARIARLNGNGSLDSSFNPGTGADWVVTSIVLQPDGNVFIGGDFTTINGVLRPHVARLYGDAVLPPSLNITRSNASVLVSWPVTGLNFQLQENTNLALPNSWSHVTLPPVTNGSQISVTAPATVGQKFFRLSR